MTYESTTAQGDCIFCKIVSGEIKTPGIFWEDDSYLAMLSIDPNTEGFSVVITKEHHGSDVMEMSEEELQLFIVATKKASTVLKNSFNDVGRIGVLMEGTGVNHAHIKLFPMHHTSELKDGGFKQYLSGREFWFDKYEGWISSESGPMADSDKLSELAQRIIKANKNS